MRILSIRRSLFNREDQRGWNAYTGKYTAIPINDAARMRVDAYDDSQRSTSLDTSSLVRTRCES